MRIRYSTRFLLLIIFAVAMLCTGLRYFIAPYDRQSRAIAELRSLGVEVHTVPTPGPLWVGKLFDSDRFVEVLLVGRPDFQPNQKRLKLDGRVIEQCRHLISLESLDLRATTITDDDLCDIRHIKSLKSLHLCETDIGDEGLRHISELEGLKSLGLKRTIVSDVGLTYLRRLTKLEKFRLESPNVKGDGLAFLRKCSHLKLLQFIGQNATNNWVQHSGPPPTLTWVEFHGTSIDEVGIALLGRCSQLKAAYLNNNPIGDEALSTLSLLQLQTLELNRTNLSAENLRTMGFSPSYDEKNPANNSWWLAK